MAFSELPQLAEKIKIFFALAPSYNLQGTLSPLLQPLHLPEVLIKVCVQNFLSHVKLYEFPFFFFLKQLGKVEANGKKLQ